MTQIAVTVFPVLIQATRYFGLGFCECYTDGFVCFSLDSYCFLIDGFCSSLPPPPPPPLVYVCVNMCACVTLCVRARVPHSVYVCK